MHKFWYHSPVRFYRTLPELQDAKNPQNTQYFGEKNPYPLELGDFHRYLIPNYQNTVVNDNLSIWVVNDKQSVFLQAVCKVTDGILKYVTFKSDIPISGRLEIRDSDNEPIFYSNCIQFLDSTDNEGRKFIRIATKHTYNRNLFDYSEPKAYMLTSLPAYCLGLNSVEADVNNARTGGISTLRTRETYLDEIVDYEFTASGDSNILNFIQVHATNNEFYIDETKRTSIDKLDKDEFSMYGKVKFTNVKDKFGFNVVISYPEIISDIYNSIYADNITYNFTYSHEPENDTDSGNWFLSNLLFNNYHNPFGIIYDCDLKFQIKSVPAKGFLANNTTRVPYGIDDIISYCDKDELVYFPNGFDNDLGVVGNYIENFSYKIVDQDGRIGRLITHTFNMTDSAAPEIDLSVSIAWSDDTSAPKTGNDGLMNVKLVSLVSDPLDPILTQEWQTFDGTTWIFYKTKTTDAETFDITLIENKIRLKVVSTYGEIAYSNNLIYTKASSTNIFITDRVPNFATGIITYKLHVENEAFVGYCNMEGNKINTRSSRIQDTYGNVLYIPNIAGIGDNTYTSQPVNIPVGVYDCQITVIGIRLSSTEDGIINAGVSYGFGTDYNSPASFDSSVIGELIIPQD